MSNKKAGISRKSGAKSTKRKGKGGKTGQLRAALILVSLCVFAAVWLWSAFGTAPQGAPSVPKAHSGMQMPGAGSSSAVGQGSSARGAYTLAGANPEEEFWPEFDYDCTSQILRHTGCVISYNADYKVPNWVLYELTFAETLGNIDRGNFNFDTDPDVPARQMAQLSDYKRSGYSRGHMAPAADLKWSVTSMAQSFYLSNVCPQDSKLNTGTWKKLETRVREWAERDSAITIVCGPILPRTAAEKGAMTTIGKGQVLVPEYFYKIVFAPFAAEPQAIGFIMPNHKCHTDLKRFVVTVDSIEARTGIDFFPVLPDDVEARVESQVDTKFWFRAK